ncbi:MAG TPA: alpha/beta hydrolase [Anaeromyxobacteraceae bacterium]|nr:alpha/beta hydrolase [Anaeromyxobacteraceae bacterium]
MLRALRMLGLVFIGLLLGLVATGIVYRPDPAPLRLRRETAVIDGTPLSYHRRGAGRDVVLLHGGMGSAEDFEPVLDQLTADYRLTVVDRPGFGLSQAPGDAATYPGNARLIAGLIRALSLVRPVIVGHSHGGGVAIAIAEDQPDVVGGLVLLAPESYPAAHAKSLDRLIALPLLGEGLAAWVGPRLGPRTVAGILKEMIGPDRARLPADFVAYRQQLWVNPRSLAVHARQQTSNAPGLARVAARLGAVRSPSIVIGCAQDPTEESSVDSRRLVRELPASELRWLEGCGHYIQYARPEVVVAAIRTIAGR